MHLSFRNKSNNIQDYRLNASKKNKILTDTLNSQKDKLSNYTGTAKKYGPLYRKYHL